MASTTLHRIKGDLMGSRVAAVISLEARLDLEEKKYDDLKIKTYIVKREKNQYRAYVTYTVSRLNREEYFRFLNEAKEYVKDLPAWKREGILAIEPRNTE